MNFGKLDFSNVSTQYDLLADSTKHAIKKYKLQGILVSAIDSNLADTQAFCEAYDIELDVCANCVVVEAKRADKVWYAACLIRAIDRADVNGTIRRHIDARKISFAPMQIATSLTKMEYGGITPIGLPEDWQILVDSAVTKNEQVIVGSGIRGSKLLLKPELLKLLPNVTVMDIAKHV